MSRTPGTVSGTSLIERIRHGETYIATVFVTASLFSSAIARCENSRIDRASSLSRLVSLERRQLDS